MVDVTAKLTISIIACWMIESITGRFEEKASYALKALK